MKINLTGGDVRQIHAAHRVGERGMSAWKIADELKKARMGIVKVKGTKKGQDSGEQMRLEQPTLSPALKLNRFVPH